MPTYEYSCLKCDHQFEKVQSMSDPVLAVCPKELCSRKKWGKGRVKRAIGTGAGLIFKGSGFYITDYRSENYKAGEKKDAPAAAKPTEGKAAEGKPAEGKAAESKPATESKPAAKSESKPVSKPAKSKSSAD